MTTWVKQDGWSAAANGSSLQGYITTTHADLVAAFGSPTFEGDMDKVTCEWVLVFDDGTVATIYDWKQYEMGTPYGRYDWHIGGHDAIAVAKVGEVLGVQGHSRPRLVRFG